VITISGIRSLADTPEFRGRGLLARFLYSMPVSRVGGRDLAHARPMPDDIRDAYRAHVRHLLALEPGCDEKGQPTPRILSLSPSAWVRMQEFQEWIEPMLGEAGELGLLTDWGAKLPGAVLRIAGLLHLWQTPNESVISESTLTAALDIGRYLIPHAEAAFLEMGADRVTEDAEVVLSYIRKTGQAQLTKRDLFTTVARSRFKTVEDLDSPLNLLESHGFIRWAAQEEHTGRGRRPSPTFEVNPDVHTPPQYPHNTQKSGHTPNSADSAADSPFVEVRL
jgi:replicative DNA helicase